MGTVPSRQIRSKLRKKEEKSLQSKGTVTTKTNAGEPTMLKCMSVHTSILSLKSFKKDTMSRRLYHETVALLERSQSQRTTCCWIQESPTGGHRKQIRGCLRPVPAQGWEAVAGSV